MPHLEDVKERRLKSEKLLEEINKKLSEELIPAGFQDGWGGWCRYRDDGTSRF